jgi:hypothetical protein
MKLPYVFRCRWATDNVQNFWKQIQKAYFQTVLNIFLISVYHYPEPREYPSRKLWQWSDYFLDHFSWLRIVIDRNQRYVQNHLEISVLNLFLKIWYIVCIPNGNGKHLSTQFLVSVIRGLRVIYGTQLMQIRYNLYLVRIMVDGQWPFQQTMTV